MLSFSLDVQGLDVVDRWINRVYELFDLTPLVAPLSDIMREQNDVARILGRDKDDVDFAVLAESTMKKRIRQGRLGPPLAPDGGGSPIVTGFVVDAEISHPDDFTLVGHWPGVPWVGYHVEPHVTPGGGIRPTRDAVGLTPTARAQAEDVFLRYIESILGESR